VTGMNIAAGLHKIITYNGDKEALAARAVSCGLKLNTVVTAEAIDNSDRGWKSSTTNEIQNGGAYIHLNGIGSDVLVPCAWGFSSAWGTAGVNKQEGRLGGLYSSAAPPNAALTTVLIRIINFTSSNNIGLDDLTVYSMAIT
jgi:hypothetical protein